MKINSYDGIKARFPRFLRVLTWWNCGDDNGACSQIQARQLGGNGYNGTLATAFRLRTNYRAQRAWIAAGCPR